MKNVQSTTIGVDLGTANTLFCTKDKGIIFNEASTIAYVVEDNTKKCYTCGDQAQELLGKAPVRIEVVHPIEDGVINDGGLSEFMVREFLTKIGKDNSSLASPIVIAGVPFSATDVEKKALQEIFERCNVKDVFLIYESLASAVGLNLEINKPVGYIVIDIGGGTTEISLISLGGIVKNRTFKYGGRKIDKSIIEYVRQKYNVIISETAAEDAKKKIATAFAKSEDTSVVVVKGRSLLTKTPQEVKITQKDMAIAIAEFTNELVENVKQVIASTPPELIEDVAKGGIYICGGGARIKNLDYVLNLITNVKVNVAFEPELCLIRGLQKIIANKQEYKHLLFKQNY